MATPNESAEELEDKDDLEDSEESQESEESSEEESKPETETKSEDEAEEKEEEQTVSLSSHTKTKDVLHRVLNRILGDENELNRLAEDDPKLLERIKAEFPKKFKDVKIKPNEEDLDERVKKLVSQQLKGDSKSNALDALREELKMTKMEFEDIRDAISEKSERYLTLELADTQKDAVLLAYKDLNPRKYREMLQKQAANEIGKRQVASKGGSSAPIDTKKFSKGILDNYKRLGFKSPQQMKDYQDPKRTISII